MVFTPSGRTEYGRLDDGIRERWFAKDRWALVSGDLETVAKFKRAACTGTIDAADGWVYGPCTCGAHHVKAGHQVFVPVTK